MNGYWGQVWETVISNEIKGLSEINLGHLYLLSLLFHFFLIKLPELHFSICKTRIKKHFYLYFIVDHYFHNYVTLGK